MIDYKRNTAIYEKAMIAMATMTPIRIMIITSSVIMMVNNFLSLFEVSSWAAWCFAGLFVNSALASKYVLSLITPSD